mgnify:CR=1 FL=1
MSATLFRHRTLPHPARRRRFILAAASAVVIAAVAPATSVSAATAPDLGDHVIVFDPSMPVSQIRATFETYWAAPDFSLYTPSDANRLRDALRAQGRAPREPGTYFDIRRDRRSSDVSKRRP